jgi:hypothetical protein
VATRTKTVIYAAQLAADVANVTLTSLGAITVYTENSSRVFKSAFVEINLSDTSTVTGATLSEMRVACSVNGAAATTITELDDLPNSGENWSGTIGPFDFTSHFTTNYPAADSTTVELSIYTDITTGTGVTTRNVSALLYLTYEYGDAAATQYFTNIIPLESTTGAMSATEAEVGTNQIPQLTGAGGLLENVAGVIVRQQFFTIDANDSLNLGTVDNTLNVRIDTGTTHTYAACVRALGAEAYKRFVHIEAPAVGAAHAFKAWSTGAAGFYHAAHTMYVTYQITVSGTTEFLYNILIPFTVPSPIGGVTAADASRARAEFYIEEPATVALKQSAIRVYWRGAGQLTTHLVKSGAQAYRTYTNNENLVTGSNVLQQRIDAGSALGAGVTLGRGTNTLTVDMYRTGTVNLGFFVTGYAIINYKSGVPAQGIMAGNHTVQYKCADWDAFLIREYITPAMAPDIPETNYFVNAIATEHLVWDYAGSNNQQGYNFQVEATGSDILGDGWISYYGDVGTVDGEIGCTILVANSAPIFRRYPQDAQTDRLLLETPRQYRQVATTVSRFGAKLLITYHSIGFTINGTISGSAGGTVTINAYRGDTGERVASTFRVGNGTYSMPWYDNTINCYVEAYEDGTHLWRSTNAVANGSP